MDPDLPQKFEADFREGIEHFNACRFWESHESWERIWLVADPTIRPFIQGLIQIAAALHHVQRGTPRGAVRLVDAALHKLAPYPESFLRIERTSLVRTTLEHQAWAVDAVARSGTESETVAPPPFPRIDRRP